MAKTGAIIELYEEMKPKVADMTHSQYAILALDAMFEMPIFSAPLFGRASRIPRATAQRILRVLRDGDVLRVAVPASGSRASVFVFPLC